MAKKMGTRKVIAIVRGENKKIRERQQLGLEKGPRGRTYDNYGEMII